MDKHWMNYPIFGLQNCIAKVILISKSPVETFEQIKRCIYKTFIRHLNCGETNTDGRIQPAFEYHKCYVQRKLSYSWNEDAEVCIRKFGFMDCGEKFKCRLHRTKI